MLRYTRVVRGHITSNMLAQPHTGRWFNPPHQWMVTDVLMVMFLLTVPPATIWFMYMLAYAPKYSHYQDRNYYPSQRYTKEFIHKYKRLERWRHY